MGEGASPTRKVLARRVGRIRGVRRRCWNPAGTADEEEPGGEEEAGGEESLFASHERDGLNLLEDDTDDVVGIVSIKDTSLFSVIGVGELVRQGQVYIANTFTAFEVYFAVAILYLMITLSLSLILRLVERRGLTAV